MAVTITLDELKEELTVTNPQDSTPDFTAVETRRLTRWREVAVRWVEDYAPEAPVDVQNEAVVRVCGYLLEIPNGPYTSLNIGGAGRYLPLRLKSGFQTLRGYGPAQPLQKETGGGDRMSWLDRILGREKRQSRPVH